MIRVTVSNVIRVECSPRSLSTAVVRELTLPNPEFMTRQRMKKWLDETPETFCIASTCGEALEIPRGYLGRLLALAKEAGLEVAVDDRRLSFLPVDFTFRGELRPYQETALDAMRKHGSGVLAAPCGSGKTALGCALIAERRQPALILVHTRDLLAQTCAAVRRWLGVEPGVIAEKTCTFGQVAVGMVQTLVRRDLEDIRNRFGLVLLDEAHHCPARTFTEVLQQFPAAFRFGLTATPERRDGLFPFLEAVIGPIRHTVTVGDLRDAGQSVVPRIKWRRTEFCSFYTADDFARLINELVRDRERNTLILETVTQAIDAGRSIIALTGRVAHAEFLAAETEKVRPGVAVAIVGAMPKRQRESAIARMRTGEARVLFATSLADEGLDVPVADCLILCTPSRDPGRVTQRLGRVLRALPGKPQPVVYDFVDVEVGVLVSQARTRFFKVYRKLVPGTRLPDWLDRKRNAA